MCAGRDDEYMIWFKSGCCGYDADGQPAFPLEKGPEIAFILGREMHNDDEREMGVLGNHLQHIFEGFDPAGRRSNSDDQIVVISFFIVSFRAVIRPTWCLGHGSFAF